MNWRAKYTNGKTVSEEDGVSSDHLNREMLMELSVMDGPLPVCTVQLSPDRRHFYRKRVSISPGAVGGAIHLLGYKEGDAWSIFAVHEDKRIEEFDKFDKAHPYLYPPRFLPHESL